VEEAVTTPKPAPTPASVQGGKVDSFSDDSHVDLVFRKVADDPVTASASHPIETYVDQFDRVWFAKEAATAKDQFLVYGEHAGQTLARMVIPEGVTPSRIAKNAKGREAAFQTKIEAKVFGLH